MRNLTRLVWALGLILGLGLTLPAEAEERDGPEHMISGVVVDADGQALPGVTVALLDQATGQPLDIETGRRLGETLITPEGQLVQDKINAWTLAVTDADGRFAFPQVLPGRYRVVAQSWHAWDHKQQREIDQPAVTEVWKADAPIVHLRGVVENVVVPSDDAAQLTLKPVGTSELHLEERNANGGYIAVLSTQPLAADPILFFLAWDDRFLSHALLTHHARGHGPAIYRGLPATTLHVSMFFYDNRPGAAAGSVTLRPNEVSTLAPHAVAAWSDGRKQPPPRLQPLMDRLIEHDWDTIEILGHPPEDLGHFALLTSRALETWGPLDREVILPDDTVTTVGDLLAVWAYRNLQASQP
ncbi:MAG: carboxypeptidase-like regulatory domain-containing protein [Planctomycetota bacterium]